MNEEPRLFIDMSFEQGNQIVMYGVSDLFKIGKNVKPQVSTVGSNFISNNNNTTEVSSGNNRSEGGNQTINKRNTRKSPNVNEGTGESNGNRVNNRSRALANTIMKREGQSKNKATRIQVVNENSNMNNTNRALAGMLGRIAPPPQGQKRKRENNNNNNKNAQSGVGSRNSMAGNKKNNLKNKATGGKKPKINVNVAQRNRLLKNLKNKNIPNITRNGMMKAFNNKKLSYNAIMQMAREEENIRAEVATFRRKKTLRSGGPNRGGGSRTRASPYGKP